MRLPDASIFRGTAFQRFWLFRFATVMGAQIQATALGWHAYDLARDRGDTIGEAAFLLGAIGLAQFAPLLALSLIGGQAADRFDRKLILAVGVGAKALIAAGLVLVSRLPGDAALPLLFAAAAGVGALNAFTPPASSSLMPQLVRRDQLPTAIAWSSLAFTTGTIIGPALGGGLYVFGPAAAYGGALALLTAGTLAILATPTPKHVALVGASAWRMIREGLGYVRANRIVLGAISLDLVVVFLAGAQAMLPVFARDVLGAGPEGLGVLRAAPAAGAALVGLGLAAAPLRANVGRWMFAAVGVFGLATLVFGASQYFWLTWAALFVAGAADMISVYVRQSLIQLATPDAMRGRVAAVSFIFISASNELGDFEAGVMARLFGPALSVVIGGVAAIGAAGAWMRMFPELAKADSFEDPALERARETAP